MLATALGVGCAKSSPIDGAVLLTSQTGNEQDTGTAPDAGLLDAAMPSDLDDASMQPAQPLTATRDAAAPDGSRGSSPPEATSPGAVEADAGPSTGDAAALLDAQPG